MPANYVLLERIELNASAASVTFSSIPQTGYTDLKIVMSGRSNVSGVYDYYKVKFNSSSTGYSERNVFGLGSSVGSETNNSTTYSFVYAIDGATATSNTFSSVDIYIPNYTSSNNKSFSIDGATETNATVTPMALTAGLWSNSAAISTISIEPVNGTALVQYSTFSLYGLAAVGSTPAIAPKASGGNITTDGTYWIHTFLSSGTFTPQTALSCDYLVVAGGGGGGSDANGIGGGGGAGGARTGTSLSALAQAYTITVGAGGAGGAAAANSTGRGSQGTNSSFSTISSTGGGGGAVARTGGAPTTGGSGGGGANTTTYAGAAGNAGSYTPVEGYAGGNGSSDGTLGGGGGGASAVGVAGSGTYPSGTAGNGGAGLTSSISGTSTVYAGGGGGGAYISGQTRGSGGTGGGGNGANGNTTTPNSAGTTNTGGGGGAGSAGLTTTYAGAAGGSGIVIIRYTIA